MTRARSAVSDRFSEPGKHYTGRCYLCQFRHDAAEGRSRCTAPDEVELPHSIFRSFDGQAMMRGLVGRWPESFDPLWLRFCDAFRKKA